MLAGRFSDQLRLIRGRGDSLAHRLPGLALLIGRARDLFPLTLRGLGIGLAAGLGLWLYGVRALDGVWYVAGVGLIVLAGLSLISVLLAALRMRLWIAKRAEASPRPEISTAMALSICSSERHPVTTAATKLVRPM